MYNESHVGINMLYLSVARVANPFSAGSGVPASSRPPILVLKYFSDTAVDEPSRLCDEFDEKVIFSAGVFRWFDTFVR